MDFNFWYYVFITDIAKTQSDVLLQILQLQISQ
jgi:hypothetical protein